MQQNHEREKRELESISKEAIKQMHDRVLMSELLNKKLADELYSLRKNNLEMTYLHKILEDELLRARFELSEFKKMSNKIEFKLIEKTDQANALVNHQMNLEKELRILYNTLREKNVSSI